MRDVGKVKTVPLSISRTQPLRRLLSRVGRTTYRLNTICVGLQCVASGAGDKGAIALAWSKPKSAQKSREVADQARIFACTSALVLNADVFESYLRELAIEHWLEISAGTRDIATKAKTRSKGRGGEYSVAERAEVVCTELGVSEPVKIAALDLLVKWRNVMAHNSGRPVTLDAARSSTLFEAASEMRDRHPDFDIAFAIANFENRKPPTPTEVTTLVAVAVRLSREIDKAAIRRSAPTAEKMCAIANQILRSHFDACARTRFSLRKELLKFQHGEPAQRRSMLKKILASGGISETKESISAILEPRYLQELSTLSHDHFTQRFGIVLP